MPIPTINKFEELENDTLGLQREHSVYLQDKDKTLSYPGDMETDDIQFHLGVNEYQKPPKDALLEVINNNPFVKAISNGINKVMSKTEWDAFAAKELGQAKAFGMMLLRSMAYSDSLSLEQKQAILGSVQPGEVQAAVEYPIKQVMRIPETVRGTLGAIADKKAPGDVAATAVRSFLKPEEVKSLTERIPWQDIEQGEWWRVIPRAILKATEDVLVYSNYGSLLERSSQLISGFKVARTQAELNKFGEAIQTKLFERGYTQSQVNEIFSDPAFYDFIRTTDRFKTITGQGIIKMYSGIPIPEMKPGDIMKIGNELGQIIRIERPNAVMVLGGKEVVKSLEELSKPSMFYRGGPESAPPAGKTALDIINYEVKELGNQDIKVHLSDSELRNIPSENTRWFATSQEAAKEYGKVSKEKIGKYRIIAEDSNGGVLLDIRPTSAQFKPAKLTLKDLQTEKRKAAEAGDTEMVKVWEKAIKDYNQRGEVVIPPEAEEVLRGFIESVRKAASTDPALQAALNATYEPLTNQETLARASKLIKDDPIKAYDLFKSTKSPTALSNAIGMKLIVEAQAAGDFTRALEIVELMAEKATQSGQAVQILSAYSKLAPEGVLKFAQGQIKQVWDAMGKNKLIQQMHALQNDIEKAAFAKKHGIPFISEAKAKELLTDALKLGEMPEGRDKLLATALLLDKITRLIPKSFLEKLSTIQILAQLLNPKTIIRNIMGNMGFQLLENISQALGTTLDIGLSKATGERTMSLPSVSTQAKGLVRGAKQGAQEAMLGVDLMGMTSKFEIPKGTVFEQPVMKALEKTLSLVLRAPDRAFYQAAFEDSLREQMKLAGVSTPTPEMINQANLDGLYRTFNDENVISRCFVGIKRALNFGQKWGIGDMIIKYPRTPANILARGIEYSPFGFTQTVYMLGKAAMQHDFNQRKFVQVTSRALVGSVLLVGTGFVLAKFGILRGKSDPNRRVKAIEKTAGLGSYQINRSALLRFVSSGMDPEMAKMQYGDELITYDWFQPSSINLAMGANMALGEENSKIGMLTEAVLDSTQTLVDQPLLQGLRKLSSTSNLVKGALEVIKEVPASFIPTLLNQVRQLADNTARNTQDTNYFKETYNKVAYKIPWLASTLPESVDVLGQLRENYQDNSNNPFNVFLNPAFVSHYNPSPAAEMVLDIWTRTGETAQLPRQAPEYIKVEGVRYDLDANKQAQFQQYIGHKTDMLFSILAQNERFMQLPDEKKAKKLQSDLTDIYNEAKWKILGVKKRR
jgi:hypothetical protein